MTPDLRHMDDERIGKLETKVELWMETTTEYRKSLCSKLDKISDKLEVLPCKERKGLYSMMQKQLTAVWCLLSGLILAVIGEFFIRHR